ncbi:coiled-coil domain-containing glutamate-rich protein 1-like [Scyliorhinus canicula]|uniref:coiled-coil domain-containing glutamate-rich protein 1-like n=1 Tax=Scyliorhinus canicula TaxID=7830 RepID=UPI0018F41643|nr:coiled-coil domain-containing glutamate-rich protein 1-like [Scyliorhinus canicula]
MGGNVANEGWKKPCSFSKRYKRCRSEHGCARQQNWRKKRQRWWRKYGRGRAQNPIDFGALLRPVNINGKRAPGMRAPRNTTQFLMHEKYQELRKQAITFPGYWHEEGDGVIDYLPHVEHLHGSREQTNAESLNVGPPERHKKPVYRWLLP